MWFNHHRWIGGGFYRLPEWGYINGVSTAITRNTTVIASKKESKYGYWEITG